jgi:putative PIN family toxin of toxin-antitoxin system
MRVVLDTNILVSGLLYVGKPKKLIDLALEGKIEVMSSLQLIDEFDKVIRRDKFKLGVAEQDVFVGFVKRLVHMIFIKSDFRVVSDLSDNVVVNTAYDGKALYIVSGDNHLLKLREFKGIRILTASEMLDMIS